MKKRVGFLITALAVGLLTLETAMADGPLVQWEKTFGGTETDIGNSVEQTSEGGFIIAGYTSSYGAGSYDLYLIKTDSSGNSQWQKTFGGGHRERGGRVRQASDGGFIVVGNTKSYGAGGTDVYLIKTDSSGNSQWQKTFGGSDYDYGTSVQQTSDGGYIICGETWSYGAGLADVYLIKTDYSGSSQWEKTFGGSEGDWGCSVQQTSDGGFVILGYTASYGAGGTDVYLIKTDSSGNSQWQKTFGGSDYDEGYSVQQISDGGFIITGYTRSYGVGNGDVYLIKTDSSGNSQWQKTFGGNELDRGQWVQQTSDGGFIVTGYTRSYGAGSADVYVIKTDSLGNSQWQQTFGGSYYDYGASVQQISNGGYIISGQTRSYGAGNQDVYLIKLAPDEGRIGKLPVVGYYPNYATDRLPIANIRYDKLTHIIYFSLSPLANGDLDTSNVNTSDLQSLVANADANDVKVLICVGGWDRSEHFSAMAADPNTCAAFVENLKQYCLNYNLQGADLDWEPVSSEPDKDNYSQLVQELNNSFDAHGLMLTVAVTPDGNELRPWAIEHVDWLNIMAYDNTPPHHSTFDFAVSALNHWETYGAPREKEVLGVPFYGKHANGDPNTYKYIIDTYHPTPEVDFVDGIGFNGINTIKQKTEYVVKNGYGGIMIWEISQDTFDETSLLTAITDTILYLSPADYDGDGDTDLADFAFFVSDWLSWSCNSQNGWCDHTDLNQNGQVDFMDFALIAQQWLEGTAP